MRADPGTELLREAREALDDLAVAVETYEYRSRAPKDRPAFPPRLCVALTRANEVRRTIATEYLGEQSP